MAVKIGSARSDEHGKAHGGQAGDQKGGKEVSTQNWYLHSKGWRVVRPRSAIVAAAMAKAMQAACDNPDIGYDQYQRDTLRTNTAPYGYDPAKTTKPVETDCSALVRVCVAYAFGKDILADVIGKTRFSTANQVKFMLDTNHFVEMKGDKYQKSSDYLLAGDVLVTKTQGHTVIVLSNGAKSGSENHVGGVPTVTEEPKTDISTGDSTIRYYDSGERVKAMQTMLLAWEPDCLPKYGADGDFGSETYAALTQFQCSLMLEEHGYCGDETLAALNLFKAEVKKVVVTASTLNVRAGVSTGFDAVGVLKNGEIIGYTAERTVSGVRWLYIGDGWICGKYTEAIQ